MSQRNNALIYYKKGHESFLKGKYKIAENAYKKALSIYPNYFQVLINLGALYQTLNQNKQASSTYFRALKINPKSTVALFNLGVINEIDENYNKALIYLKKVHKLDPKDIVTINKLGLIYKKTGNYKRAKDLFTQVTKINPNFTEVFINLGNLYTDQANITRNKRELDKAEKAFTKVININPNHIRALTNLGSISTKNGNYKKAIRFYKRVLKVDSNSALTFHNLATVYEEKKQLNLAIKYYEKALKIEPNLGGSLANLAYAYRQICEWNKYKSILERLDRHTKTNLKLGSKSAETPFFNIVRSTNPNYNLRVATIWSSETKKAVEKFNKLKFSFKKNRGIKKIRIGYASDAFREYPTTHNLTGVLEKHNREEFEIIAVSFSPDDKTKYRKRVVSAVDRFIDVEKKGLVETVKIINKKVDILVDLKGYTGGNRFELFAMKPAPIQVSWLGFIGSTGAKFIDYFIADKIVITKSQEKYFTEKIVYLPHTYRPMDDKSIMAKMRFERGDFNLRKNGIVFSSFNQPYKIEPEIFDVWMGILKKIPNSVLWQWRRNKFVEKCLKKEAKVRGVNPDRIIFARNLLRENHLARISLADIALDTKTVNGHTTTVDALWAGVPVITIRGKHFASRVSASVLKAAGLPDLITSNLTDYEKLIIDFAKNPRKLLRLKLKLENRKNTAPLFNTARFTRNLEKSYKKMWQIYNNGRKPRSFSVKDE